MTRLTAVLEPRRAAEALETLRAEQVERARTALATVSQRAKAARERAQGRALAQFDRGRSLAADRLEGVVDALRPDHSARSRRRAVAIAGGGGVVILAAVGLGVGLGLMWSKRLKKKQQARERLAASDGGDPVAALHDSAVAGVAAPVVY